MRRPLTLLALAALGLAACDATYDNPPVAADNTIETITTQAGGVQVTSGDPNVTTATIASVHDGDTFTLGDGERVRPIGINAPEIKGKVDGPDGPQNDECWGAPATRALQDLLRPGDPVTLIRDKTNRDKYGRLLRYVEIGNHLDVGEAMVINGNAKAKRYGKDVARGDKYDVAQAVAKEYGRGLWGEC